MNFGQATPSQTSLEEIEYECKKTKHSGDGTEGHSRGVVDVRRADEAQNACQADEGGNGYETQPKVASAVVRGGEAVHVPHDFDTSK